MRVSKRKPIRIFLSSPGDVPAERAAVRKVVAEFRRIPDWSDRCDLDILAYEERVPPDAGRSPQLIVDEHMRKAGESDIVICILCHRMGTPVIDTASGKEYPSGTAYEFESAYEANQKNHGRPVVMLYRGNKPFPAKAPRDAYEQFGRVRDFFEEFEPRKGKFQGLYAEYSSDGEFEDDVRVHLQQHLGKLLPARIKTNKPPAPKDDPQRYLAWLAAETRQIRITGLTSKRAEPYFFPIDEIYIRLSTLSAQDRTHHPDQQMDHQKRVALELALQQRRVAIVGDAGSGKSTFLRRVAFELCRPPAERAFLPPHDTRFPILIRVADLAAALAKDAPHKQPDSPDWVPWFLGRQAADYHWGVSEAFFAKILERERCLVMFDGLDEAPDARVRQRIARIFERATAAFAQSDFLVSTRPQTNVGDAVVKDFHTVRILPLEMPEIRTFFEHFTKALALTESEAKRFQEELEYALTTRREIRAMAENAVMLTALAVLQHNDQRLPEFRVDLYGSILGWLAAARKREDGLKAMRRLALHMQDAPGGERLVQMNKRLAAEFLAGEFGGDVEERVVHLEEETAKSGIIASVGTDLKFSHLSFQEYLAALEIGGFLEKDLKARVVSSGKLYHAEWRETMRLLGGVLLRQGEPKIAGLFHAILGMLGESPTLANQAKCAGLLGVLMRDLGPMGYAPKMPGYEKTVKAVMRIFEVGAEEIPLKTRIEAADALGQVGDPRLVGRNWVEISAGSFWMGAQKEDPQGRNYDPEALENEPVHEVRIEKAFRIAKYPVTVQEYEEFLDEWRERGDAKFQEPEDWEKQKAFRNRPVVGVSWHEATKFCEWAGGRLPTEEEWERVARGPAWSRYPWGDEGELDDSRANYYEGKVGSPTPVGLYPKGTSQERVCDLLGNVFEWTSSLYDSEQNRVVRGGSWSFNRWDARVSLRDRLEPAYRDDGVGFRLAGDIP